jgi:hypothetical protein
MFLILYFCNLELFASTYLITNDVDVIAALEKVVNNIELNIKFIVYCYEASKSDLEIDNL